jgi:hypothetical protein
MNMLRDEKNQEYRLVIKNTLEFDPEILKRYVNFMNNPDERTAVDQFGKGDKYFGICTMMATLPGLPMFGHGQIEGFTEKYGMEYRRAYYDEHPDDYLVRRHEREIFPLLRKRYLFGEGHNFLLYDFYTPEGYVNEDVYAYSNRAGDERALVIYHNKYASTRGWVRLSAAYPVKTGQGDERTLVQKTLGQGLGLSTEPRYFTIFRDQVSGLEYIRGNQELNEQGLYIELEAYKCHVFLDFRQVQDDAGGRYAKLASYLVGGGATSIQEAMTEMELQSVLRPFRDLVNPGMFRWLIEQRVRLAEETERPATFEQALDEVYEKELAVLKEARRLIDGQGDAEAIAREVQLSLRAALELAVPGPKVITPAGKDLLPPGKGIPSESLPEGESEQFLRSGPGGKLPLDGDYPAVWGTLLSWLFTSRLGQITGEEDEGEQSRTWIDEWLLGKIIARTLGEMGLDEGSAARCVSLVRILASHQDWFDPRIPAKEQATIALRAWLKDSEVQSFIQVNRYQGLLWFNQESFEELLWWMYTAAIINLPGLKYLADREACFKVIRRLLDAEAQSGYQIEKLLQAVKPTG